MGHGCASHACNVALLVKSRRLAETPRNATATAWQTRRARTPFTSTCLPPSLHAHRTALRPHPLNLEVIASQPMTPSQSTV
jgi:hypothetical protein